MMKNTKAYYHLPGLFEFYELYKVFLPLFFEHREYFYDWCEIGSIYGAPADCMWGGGRVGYGEADPDKVASLMQKFGISARLTFSNSLLEKEHLSDKKCNRLCKLFQNKEMAGMNENDTLANGIIIYSDLLLDYISKNYPGFYFVSSTTKVFREFDELVKELDRDEFKYVVPDFRLNKELDMLKLLTDHQKEKVEFLCNECCDFDCSDRKACYENVSRMNLSEDVIEHRCTGRKGSRGYTFSGAMAGPGFIGIEAIRDVYLPMGFSNFKIEGRSLGSAMILEFLLYYMTRPEYQLKVREEIYLDSMLDLF